MEGLFVFLFGLTLTIVGALWGRKRWKLRRDGVQSLGTVVDLAVTMGIPKGYYPVVEFETDDGHTIRFRGSTGTESSSPYRQGQRVKVIYSRQDPSDCQMANFEQFWLGPVGIGVAGLLILGVFLRFFVF